MMYYCFKLTYLILKPKIFLEMHEFHFDHNPEINTPVLELIQHRLDMKSLVQIVEKIKGV